MSKQKLIAGFLIGSGALLLGMKGSSKAQECSSFKVPESVNMSVRSNGKVQNPPKGAVFQPIINTVILPEGFKAVGGNGQMLIACR